MDIAVVKMWQMSDPADQYLLPLCARSRFLHKQIARRSGALQLSRDRLLYEAKGGGE